jgi:hypothetical protein
MHGWNEALRVDLGVADFQTILAQLANAPPRRMRPAIAALGAPKEQNVGGH